MKNSMMIQCQISPSDSDSESDEVSHTPHIFSGEVLQSCTQLLKVCIDDIREHEGYTKEI